MLHVLNSVSRPLCPGCSFGVKIDSIAVDLILREHFTILLSRLITLVRSKFSIVWVQLNSSAPSDLLYERGNGTQEVRARAAAQQMQGLWRYTYTLCFNSAAS